MPPEIALGKLELEFHIRKKGVKTGSMETLGMESRRKWFLAQLESRRMERLRMERLRKTFSSNWNQVEWKDIEWNHSERLLA
jgi:hypothetical protein